MAGLQTASDFNLLASEVLAMLHRPERNMIRIAQLELQINQLVRSGMLSKPVALSVQALIHELKGEKSRAVSAALSAISEIKDSSDDSIASLHNSIAVLSIFGLYEKAFELEDEWLQKWPKNIALLNQVIVSAYVVAQYQRALFYLGQLESIMQGNLPYEMADRRKSLIALAVTASAMGYSDSDILKRLLCARAAVLDFGLEVVREKRGQLEDGSFITYYYLIAERDICAECSLSIYDRLGGEFKDTGMDLFSIICRPLSDYDGPIVWKAKQ